MHGSRTHFALVLLVLSAALHGLWLAEPRSVVFDEVHFGGFAEAYLSSRAYFFDIHPPHAKLLIAGTARLVGYEGGQPFAALGEAFPEPAALRLAPALAGTLIPLVCYALLLQLGARPATAFLAGLAIALDTGLLLQTRLIALDGTLILATLAALCAAIASLRSPRGPGTAWAIAAGAAGGLAVGTKFTGGAALALIGLCLAVHLAERPCAERLGRVMSRGAWVLGAAVVVYLLGWIAHFALLNQPGPGYAFGAPSGDFLHDLVQVHGSMLGSNYGLTATHPDASPWWSWPLMLGPVFYAMPPSGPLYFIGNPAVWWGSTLGLLAAAGCGGLAVLRGKGIARSGGRAAESGRGESDSRARPAESRRRSATGACATGNAERESGSRLLWVPVAGFAISYLPLIPVPRPLFLYHYLTPLVFGVCAVCLWLDSLGWTRAGGFRAQCRSYHAAAGALVLGFAAAAPFALGFVEAPGYQEWLLAHVPGWR